jgi:hypothetical protein
MALLFGIQHFLREIRLRFAQLEISQESANQATPPIDLLHDHFTTSSGLYLLIVLTFLPFVAIKINALYSGFKPFFYQGEPTLWALMLDIYNSTLSYFVLYLLAVVLWMIFNIYWVLSKINNELYYESLKMKPLDTDKVGGLRNIRDLILNLSIYYFIIIILTMSTNLTYHNQHFVLYLYEGMSLIIFWLIGVVFSLIAWLALRRLLKKKIEKDISLLNDILEGKRSQLVDLIKNNKERESQDQMNSLSKSLDIVNKERDRILQYKIKPIDARTIILFISSSFLSLITIVKVLEDAGKSKIIMFAVDQSRPYLGDYISRFLQYLLN